MQNVLFCGEETLQIQSIWKLLIEHGTIYFSETQGRKVTFIIKDNSISS